MEQDPALRDPYHVVQLANKALDEVRRGGLEAAHRGSWLSVGWGGDE